VDSASQWGFSWLIANCEQRYATDLIIFSTDAESHLSHLDTVLTLLGKHGVTLKAQKCHLFTIEVEYLGHVVRPGRLSVNE